MSAHGTLPCLGCPQTPRCHGCPLATSHAVLNHVSSGGLAQGEHRPWPQALRSRIVAATEAVQALDLDDAITILETLAADLAVLDHAYEATSAEHAYRRWKNES